MLEGGRALHAVPRADPEDLIVRLARSLASLSGALRRRRALACRPQCRGPAYRAVELAWRAAVESELKLKIYRGPGRLVAKAEPSLTRLHLGNDLQGSLRRGRGEPKHSDGRRSAQ